MDANQRFPGHKQLQQHPGHDDGDVQKVENDKGVTHLSDQDGFNAKPRVNL